MDVFVDFFFLLPAFVSRTRSRVSVPLSETSRLRAILQVALGISNRVGAYSAWFCACWRLNGASFLPIQTFVPLELSRHIDFRSNHIALAVTI